MTPRTWRTIPIAALFCGALAEYACGSGQPTAPAIVGPADAAAGETGQAASDADASDGTDAAIADSSEVQPEASAPACLDDDLSAWPDRPLPAVLEAGDFRISVTASGVIGVSNQAAPGRSLYSSSMPWMLAEQRVVDAKDLQGSFDIQEQVLLSCSQQRLDRVAQGPGGASLQGGFDDGGPACSGLTWELRFCAGATGHLSFRATTGEVSFNSITLRADSVPTERIYGMGEQFPRQTLDLKGRVIPVLSQEGGIGRGHPVISPAVNLVSPGAAGSESSTYYAAPYFFTNRLRSLFLENSEYAVFDFGADQTRIRVLAPYVSGQILYGNAPLELIERFTEYAGRMPGLPAWAHQGALVALARSPADSEPVVAALRAHGTEIAAVWNQTWPGKVNTYVGEQVLWNWVLGLPGWAEYVEALQTQGIRVLCYVNPMFVNPPAQSLPVARNLFQEGIDGGFFVRNPHGDPYLLQITAFEAGLLDLTNDEARAWMKQIIKTELLQKASCSGWMADFGEALPFDAVLHSGESAASFHNRYPVEWIRLHREALEEAGALGTALVFHRSGHTTSPSYSMLLWEGDQLTTWDEYDGLVSALHGLLNAGLSGVSLVHSDTGGYTSLSQYGLGYSREAEQLKRWTEMNAFTAVLRTHEGNQPAANAQIYTDDEAMAHFARFSRVYKALSFYRLQLEHEASTRGWPMVRHLMLHYPDDDESWSTDDEFLLGSELLLAPIKSKCWTWPVCPYDKDVYLPPGQWVHLWSGKVVGQTGAGSHVSVPAPIGEPAVFYRKGSVIGAQFVDNLHAAGIEAADPP